MKIQPKPMKDILKDLRQNKKCKSNKHSKNDYIFEMLAITDI